MTTLYLWSLPLGYRTLGMFLLYRYPKIQIKVSRDSGCTEPPYKASPRQLLSSSELQTLLRVAKALILPLEIHNPGLLHKAFNRTFNYEAVGLLESHDLHKFKFNYVKQHI